MYKATIIVDLLQICLWHYSANDMTYIARAKRQENVFVLYIGHGIKCRNTCTIARLVFHFKSIKTFTFLLIFHFSIYIMVNFFLFSFKVKVY